MADDLLLTKVHEVSDLELACLLCLVSREHCIISTEPDSLDRLVQELQLISTSTFALKPVVIDCNAQTTLDDFAIGIQIPSGPSPPVATAPRSPSPFRRTQSHNPQASFGHTSYHTAHSPGHLAPLTPATTGAETSNHNRWAASPAATTTAAVTTTGEVANVILAKNLNLAPKNVQIQALELLRTRRLFTRSSMLVAPRQFMFIAVLSTSNPGNGGETESPHPSAPVRLNPHLNDFFYMAHWHDPADRLVNLDLIAEESEKDRDRYTTEDEDDSWFGRPDHETKISGVRVDEYSFSPSYDDDDVETASFESVVRTKRGSPDTAATPRHSYGQSRGATPTALGPSPMPPPSATATAKKPTMFPLPLHIASDPVFPESDISKLSRLADNVMVDLDVTRYQMNIISFLRLHRAVALAGGTGVGSGVYSPTATRFFSKLMRCLAPLHGIGFVTPALVALAAKKVYLHRIEVTAPEKERSMQWGSDLGAIREILEGVGPEDVIEDVLHMVATPL